MEYYNNYLSGRFCNVHTFLDTLIAAANHHNRLILKEFRITSCAVGYAHTGQFFLAGDSQYPSRGASGNNHSLCLVFMAAGKHLFRVSQSIQLASPAHVEFQRQTFLHAPPFARQGPVHWKRGCRGNSQFHGWCMHVLRCFLFLKQGFLVSLVRHRLQLQAR